MKIMRLGVVEVPVALNPVYDRFYARQEVENFFEENRKSFCPFVSFLHLMSQTVVGTFCYFIALLLWCLHVFVYIF